jgi:hypothetical protein
MVNGGCSHFCFPIPAKTSNGSRTVQKQCGCPFGMKLGDDNLHCEVNATEKRTEGEYCVSIRFTIYRKVIDYSTIIILS